MFSSTSIPVDQETAPPHLSLKQITDATDDDLHFSDIVVPAMFPRRSSFELFDDTTYGTLDNPFTTADLFSTALHGSSHGSFSFDSSSLWDAVNKSKEARTILKTKPLTREFSFVSDFSMTGDELSDAVEPWSMNTNSRFDFGFSAALHDTCMFHVPREFLPSDDDTDIDDGTDTEVATEVNEDEIEDSDSDSVTVCADEPEPGSPTLECHSMVEPASQIHPIEVSSHFFAPYCVPDSWPPATPSGRLVAPLPRRSARIPRISSRAKHIDYEALSSSTTPTKRKRSPSPKDPKLSKRVAFTGKSDKPTIRDPARNNSPTKRSSPRVKKAVNKSPPAVLRVV
ncbi:hypothetical protein B0H10DRAFT_2242892 [Mycena sp. CBHHK59/15]|nr:hypothetical protein B0H10DRAFT_2242892 [Mycena sp. CBHHK59/15]